MDQIEAALRAVSSPENLSTYAERGFRTVNRGRVLASLTRAGHDPDDALVAAHAAVESLGGFSVSTERDAGLGGSRAAWRQIYEVWMVPEGVADSQAA